MIRLLWQLAMDKEILASNENQMRYTASLPLGKTRIDYKWVYKAKYKVDRSLKRVKARLFIKGFTRKAEIDYVGKNNYNFYDYDYQERLVTIATRYKQCFPPWR